MKLVIQRVSHACVEVNSKVVGEIGTGLLVLVGVGPDDSQEDIDWLSNKLLNMRIFSDEEGRMNLSVKDISGSILSVSQFTLFAKTKKGNRPSFTQSAQPELAKELYHQWCEYLNNQIHHQAGVFAADMKVLLTNDGPVTIIIDSKNKE